MSKNRKSMDLFADQLSFQFGGPEPDSNFNETASVLIAEGRLEDARHVLESALCGMPADWKPICQSGEFLNIAFWNEEEFLAYAVRARRAEMSVVWTRGSYSKAWYQLANIAVDSGQLDGGLMCLNRGIELESDHPELWCEKGYVLARMNRCREALDCYSRAATVREWAPDATIARALRGQGSRLLDLSRWDEAEICFRRSLDLEPESEFARRELDYIRGLSRQGR